MDKKLKVADFATLLGIAPKTVYKMIERNEIMTVNEKVNNRQTTLVITNDEQIVELKKNYGKYQVNNLNCYNSVTDSNQQEQYTESYEPVKQSFNNDFANEVIDKIITLNNGYNEQLNEYNDRLQRVNEELITAKSKMLLLEDKAGREGYYINEINGLKTDNNRLKKVIYGLFVFIVLLLLSMAVYITAQIITDNVAKSTVNNEQNTVIQEQKKEVKPTAQPHKQIKK